MSVLSLDIALRQSGFDLQAALEMELTGITALFGPSGAGKSTLLRVIAGLEPDATGRVAYGGAVWQDRAGAFIPSHRRGAGLVFQDGRLFSHLNVLGNLTFAARRAPKDGAAITQDAVVTALDLTPLLKRPVDGLSVGERQRVAIARALLSRPRLLMMDEPLSGLDIKRKAAILPYIADLPRRFGVPVLYVSHSIGEVARIADAMIAIQGGRITQTGPLADVFARLDIDGGGSRFEAGVILRAMVSGQDHAFGLTRLALGDQSLTMPGVSLANGQQVQLRVRARDVLLATVRPEGLSAQNVLEARVTEVLEEDGPFAEVFLEVAGQALRSRVTRAAVAQLHLAPGRQVFAVLKAISFDRRVM